MKIESVEISSLNPDSANVRKHDEKNLDAIRSSLARFGQQKPIVVGAGNIILAGNGTYQSAKALGWDEIDIVRTTLTGAEAVAYAIADNRTGELAEWDDEALASVLQSLDGDGILEGTGFGGDDLGELLEAITPGDGGGGDAYSGKIEIPIYEPSDKCPEVSDLYSNEKAAELLGGIEAAELPENIRDFLTMAAGRHVVFDYGKIADFYAHADPAIQKLFEDSALVVIDFDKAIEDGYVQLSEEMALEYTSSKGGTDEE